MNEDSAYEDIRHWFLRPSKWGIDLMHSHHRKRWLCNKRDESGWYCFKCNTKAPEEIQFIADLAKCWFNAKVDDVSSVEDYLLQ